MAEMSFKVTEADNLAIVIEGREQTADSAWFRGEHCNFNPSLANMRSADAIQSFILSGWMPAAPFIDPSTRITAFGSCFAGHIRDYLGARRYSVLSAGNPDAHLVRMGEGMVNTYALRQQFDWAYNGWKPPVQLWYGFKAENYGYDEQVRSATREMFDRTDVFILTLGLSEVWYDEPTGEVFWRAVPQSAYDPQRHKFRVTTVAENKDNLRAIYRTIRHRRPDARLIITLSPIPLVATFRPNSCITANSASKAILRAALDEFYREVSGEGKLFYWPSYEIIQEAFGAGRWYDDRRHIVNEALDYVMRLFEMHFCTDTDAGRGILRALVAAKAATGEIPPDVHRAIEQGLVQRAREFVEQRRAAGDHETAALIEQTLSQTTSPLPRATAPAALEAKPPSLVRRFLGHRTT